MKRIPHGAGLGGGSSDAAAVLRGLNELFDAPLVPEELHEIASALGSDVPFFLGNGPAYCRGRGELLEPVAALPERRMLLIKPPFPIPTAWVYQRYAEMLAGKSTHQVEETQWLGEIPLFNHLESPVFDKYLLLPVMKRWLREFAGVESAFMTGSGSTLVAIIEPDTPEGFALELREAILVQYGSTFWMTETGWANDKSVRH
jgi:4-diphosphocytidyl-2-C-methyl-D-erythritol kinase